MLRVCINMLGGLCSIIGTQIVNKILNSYLHLPVQSGSNKVLSSMNRKYSKEDYLKIIEKLRKANPNIALSSDFIIGYPGETDKDFQATLNLVKEVGFAQAYSFKYSSRPGTKSSRQENNEVCLKEKDNRLKDYGQKDNRQKDNEQQIMNKG